MGDIRESYTRRGFIGAMGAMGLMGAMGAASPAKAEEAAFTPAEPVAHDESGFVPGGGSFAEGALDLGWTGTPEEIAAKGGSTMPLAELNRRRQAYIDFLGEYTCADGTVVPAEYVKMRAIVNSYGIGCGSTPHDGSFAGLMREFTPEQAQAYVEMPMGVKFSPIDFMEKSGRPLEECREMCETLADGGYLCRFQTNDGTLYHQVPQFQGSSEYHIRECMEEPGYNTTYGTAGIDYIPHDFGSSGTPTFYAIPCDSSVIAEGSGPLPYDDAQAIIRSKGEDATFAIAPCYCRYTALADAGVEDIPSFEDFATGELEDYFSPLCDLRVETCLMTGDEAAYWISKGIARPISMEDALRFVKRSADDGFILESSFSKGSGTICSCHSDCCGILMQWQMLGGADAIASSQPFGQISHYMLEVDLDSCIACGTCAQRCPLHAITMDGEDGKPQVNAMCFRCGQCAYVCPAQARKLVARPAEENLELPDDFLDDDNMKAAYRFEHGLIG